MGFATPCFIRKNTPELRKKLAVLGYKYDYRADFCHDIIYVDAERNEFFPTFSSNITDNEIAIDCGTNEELFIAISALRDDTDDNQWFTDSKEWFQCQYLKVGMHYHDKPEILFEKWHKATVNELVEHFKEGEE